ncbi:uncharacterized protein LOC100185965 [Ciona intestinalis]
MQNRSSSGSYDWGSVAEWTVTDSNWFFYTENSNCKDTEGAEETECWINRVSSFIDDPVASTLRSCIYEYSSYKYSTTNDSVSRKKRQTIRSPTLPSMPPCPNVVRTLYRMALLEEIPRKKRRQISRGVPEVPNFDIDVVAGFVENYTSCSECSRYNEGEAAAQCWTNRFDQLTKDNSVLKEAIQRVNARFAGGGSRVGICRGNVFWTQWYNSGSPGHSLAGGDSETLAHVLSSYRTRVCHIPTGIQARIVSSDQPYGRANQTLVITPLTGLICLNKDQDNGQCRDYKVRYCCSDAVGLCPLRHGWTQFFDNDDPRGLGDFELLSRIKRRNPGRVCSTPVAISARLLDGKPYQEGGNILHLSPIIGLSCFNFQQGRRNRCKDYQVRFCCPDTVGFCPNRRMWTRWFDSRNLEGDVERIDRIRQTRPRFCPNPIAVRAQVSNTHRPFYTGGDRVRMLPNVGLICRNSEQRNNKTCSNYRVKFCCSTNLIEVTLAPGTTPPPTTTTTTTTTTPTTTTPTTTTTTTTAVSTTTRGRRWWWNHPNNARGRG